MSELLRMHFNISALEILLLSLTYQRCQCLFLPCSSLFFVSDINECEALNFYKFFLWCIDHPWLKCATKAPNISLGETVKARLKQFSVMNRLKKKALRVTLHHHPK